MVGQIAWQNERKKKKIIKKRAQKPLIQQRKSNINQLRSFVLLYNVSLTHINLTEYDSEICIKSSDWMKTKGEKLRWNERQNGKRAKRQFDHNRSNAKLLLRSKNQFGNCISSASLLFPYASFYWWNNQASIKSISQSVERTFQENLSINCKNVKVSKLSLEMRNLEGEGKKRNTNSLHWTPLVTIRLIP